MTGPATHCGRPNPAPSEAGTEVSACETATARSAATHSSSATTSTLLLPGTSLQGAGKAQQTVVGVPLGPHHLKGVQELVELVQVSFMDQ